jgi:hypothetical protein
MTGFNNQAYSALVKDLLNDAFYIGDRSHRRTIATIRQYAGVIVRRILDLSNEERVTLGNKRILEALKRSSDGSLLLLDALKQIADLGNECTHTQRLGQITDKEVESTVESLFDLYAFLFVNYFKRYRFGKNEEIQSSFSILPPIIRYKALTSLYDGDKDNVSIIDKLSLAILKAFDESKALEWLDEKKDYLKNMSSITSESASYLERILGESTAKVIINQAQNMYDLCSGRVKNVSTIIQDKGRLYYDFESAIDIYREKGVVAGESDEISEFNRLMEFVYLGRRSRPNETLKERDAYIIMDNLCFD